MKENEKKGKEKGGKKEKGEGISVSVRVRPLNSKEKKVCGEGWVVDGNTLTQLVNGKMVSSSSYTFDQVYDSDSQTNVIFEKTAKNIINSVLEGIHGTIFAYGQTSSGKTFTMQGNREHPGIIPLSIRHIFSKIEEDNDREYLLRVSYMEIYNENIIDLLAPAGSDPLKIKESVSSGVFVSGLKEEIVSSPSQVLQIMRRGGSSRHVGSTSMNERSSRSHTLFRVVIESAQKNGEEKKEKDPKKGLQGAVKVALLTLVDLAGSERANHTQAAGVRLREGAHINTSLHYLSHVIHLLSQGQTGHIPYRNSSLTRILQPALGGNGRTAIISTVTMADTYAEETLSTLKFATSAKSIKNKPIVNEVMDEQTALRTYRRQIEELQKKLAQQNESGDRLNLEEYQKLQEDREEMERRLEEEEQHRKSQEETIRKLQEKILTAKTQQLASVSRRGGAGFGGGGKAKSKKSRRLTVCVGDIRGQQTLTFGEDDIDDDLQEGEGEEDHDWEWGNSAISSVLSSSSSSHSMFAVPSKSGGPGDQLEREKERGGQKGLSEMKGFGFSPIRFNEGPSSSSLASFSLLNSPLSSSNSSSSSSENYMDSFLEIDSPLKIQSGDHKELLEELENLRSQNQKLTEKIEGIEEEFKEKTELNDILNEEILQVEKQLKVTDLEIQQLRAHKKDAEEKIDYLIEELGDNQDHRQKALLLANMDSIQKKNQALLNENEQLHKELKKQEEKEDELLKEIEEKHERIDELELDLQKFEWDHQLFQKSMDENTALTARFQELQTQLKLHCMTEGSSSSSSSSNECLLSARVLRLQRLVNQSKEFFLQLIREKEEKEDFQVPSLPKADELFCGVDDLVKEEDIPLDCLDGGEKWDQMFRQAETSMEILRDAIDVQYASLHSRYLEAQEKHQSLESNSALSLEALEEKEKILNNLKNQTEKEIKEKERRGGVIRVLEEELASLSSESSLSSSLKEEKESLELKIQELTESLSRTQSDLQEREKAFLSQSQTIETQSQQISNYFSQLQLQQRTQTKEKEEKDEMAAKYCERVVELESSVERERREREEMSQQIEEMKRLAVESEKEREEEREREKEKEKEIELITKQRMDQVVSEQHTLQEEKENLAVNLQETQKEIDILRSQNEELEKDLFQSRQQQEQQLQQQQQQQLQLHQLPSLLRTPTEQNTTKKHQEKLLRQKIENQDKELEDLRKETSRLRARNQDLLLELDQQRREGGARGGEGMIMDRRMSSIPSSSDRRKSVAFGIGGGGKRNGGGGNCVGLGMGDHEELRLAKQEVKKLELQNKSVLKEKEAMQREVERKEKGREKDEMKMKQLIVDKGVLETERVQSEREMKELKRKVFLLEKEVEKVSGCKVKCNELTVELGGVIKKYEKAVRDIEKLRQENQMLESSVSSKNNALNEAYQEIEKAEIRRRTMCSEMEEAQNTIISLHTSLSRQSAEIKEMEDEKRELEKAVDELSRQLDEASRKIEELETQLHHTVSSASQMEAHFSRLSAEWTDQHKSLNQQVNELESKIEILKEEKEKLNQNLSSSLSQNDSLIQKLEETNGSLSQLKEMLQEQRLQNESLLSKQNQMKEESEKQKEMSDEKIQDLILQSASISHDAEAQYQQLKEQSERDLKREIDLFREKEEGLREEMRENEERSQFSLRNLTHEKDEMEKQFETMMDTQHNNFLENEKQLRNENKQIREQFENQISEMKENHSQIENDLFLQIQNLNREKEITEETNATKQSELECSRLDLESQIQDKEEELRSTMGDLENKQSEIEKLEELLRQTQVHLEKLESKLRSASEKESKMKSLMEEKERMTSSLSSLQKERDHLVSSQKEENEKRERGESEKKEREEELKKKVEELLRTLEERENEREMERALDLEVEKEREHEREREKRERDDLFSQLEEREREIKSLQQEIKEKKESLSSSMKEAVEREEREREGEKRMGEEMEELKRVAEERDEREKEKEKRMRVEMEELKKELEKWKMEAGQLSEVESPSGFQENGNPRAALRALKYDNHQYKKKLKNFSLEIAKLKQVIEQQNEYVVMMEEENLTLSSEQICKNCESKENAPTPTNAN